MIMISFNIFCVLLNQKYICKVYIQVWSLYVRKERAENLLVF